MAEELNFTHNGQGRWETSFTSSGDRIAVELNRVESGTLIIFGNLEGLEKTTLHNFGPGSDQDLMFEIDAPEDVKLTLVSYTEVTAAKITGV